MPRKITDPVSQGLPSKFYLLAFVEPDTIYAQAEKLNEYKENQKQAYPNKLYPIRDKFEEGGWLKEVGKRNNGTIWQATPQPILERIEAILQELKNVELTEEEANEIYKFLDSDVREHLKTRDFDYSKEIDAAKEIIICFDQLTISSWLMREKYPEKMLKQQLAKRHKQKRRYKAQYHKFKKTKTGSELQKHFRSDDVFQDPQMINWLFSLPKNLLDKVKGLTSYSRMRIRDEQLEQDLGKVSGQES